ncbi:cation:proton antiporter, partial [Treponema sp. OttesenSCG-928-L16]|nr:cation:proton antiporter [Treponema sp. OttesenSCG-928-L16]
MELGINVLFALILGGGWIFGKLFSKMRLPAVLGMVIFGILCSVFLRSRTSPVLWELAPFLKSLALIVILLRAGLGISRASLKKVGISALLMASVPCLIEGFTLMGLFRLFFGFSWAAAGLTGFMLAAVSPAVVVPSMLDLKEQGHDEVPTLIIAGASIDDVFAITFFSVFLNMAQSNSLSIASAALSVPLSLLIGIISGIILGFILSWFFSKNYERIRATEKMLLILVFGTLLVQVGDLLHFAALLGIMTAGFILLER